MSSHVASAQNTSGPWEGKQLALGSSYGKLMMWFFLLSDAFTFSAFLTAYGFFRFSAPVWPNPEIVFQSVPFIVDHGAPLVFVGIMTFILIASSLTMVLAVEAGHRKSNKEVAKYLVYTIIGGAMFLGCQALEWEHLLHQGLSIKTSLTDFEAAHVAEADHATDRVFYPVAGIPENAAVLPEGSAPMLDANGVAILNDAGQAVKLSAEEVAALEIPNGTTMMFGKLFFFITGFHGTHVFSGLIILVVLLVNVLKGTYIRRGHYEMVEKVGLYWHFVDLVWVFVFTLFYLI